MSDITMCKGTDCVQKETCFRFTAVPKKYGQSYFEMPPREKNDVYGCEHFLKNEVEAWDLVFLKKCPKRKVCFRYPGVQHVVCIEHVGRPRCQLLVKVSGACCLWAKFL